MTDKNENPMEIIIIEKTNSNITPKATKIPKSWITCIFEETSDINPIAVVALVRKHGKAIKLTLFTIKSIFFFPGFS